MVSYESIKSHIAEIVKIIREYILSTKISSNIIITDKTVKFEK